MLSPDVRSTTPGYCTLLQVVTKRRGDDYIPVNILFIAHISAILCDNCIVPGLKCSLLYIARSAAFDGELIITESGRLYGLAVICGAMRLNCIFPRAAWERDIRFFNG